MKEKIQFLINFLEENTYEFATKPLYNSLEVGFRHNQLTPKEKEERYRLCCKFISQDIEYVIKELRSILKENND